MSSSAAAVLRSACYALRRPPFPRAALIERPQPPARLWSSTRRFYSADRTTVGKPETTNKAAAAAMESHDRKLDEILRAFDKLAVVLKEYKKEVERERRRVLARRIIFAGGVLAAAIYVKRRFFTTEDKEISAGNN